MINASVERAIGGELRVEPTTPPGELNPWKYSIIWDVTFVLNIINNADKASRFVKLDGQRLEFKINHIFI